MEIQNISRVIGRLTEKYVLSAMEGGRDCRVLVPGLTQNIAHQLHEYLQGCLPRSIVKPYLVIGEDGQPNEAEGWITAVGLTSKRIGSFIAVVNPGQLAQIQDSIRGSGGTIRLLTFSEEWPWIDNGSEQFRFDGPILDAIVKEWSSNQDEQDWLRSFILDGLVRHTRFHSRRAQVLLEEILGEFNPTSYPEIADLRGKFLFHAGIPCPTGTVPPVKDTIQNSVKLCKAIVERCQKYEGVREQARDAILEIADIPSNELENIKQSLDQFLDGIGRSSTLDLGLLAFHGCWGYDCEDTSHWRRLHADRLADLFDVRLRQMAEVSYDVHCERGHVSDDGKKLATFAGEDVTLDITYRIPVDQFDQGPWIVQVLNRQRTIVEQPLVDPEGMINLRFNTSNITGNYSRAIPLRVTLVSGQDVQADTRLNLHLCGQGRPAFVVVEHLFDVVDATAASEEEISDKKISTNQAVHLFLFNHNIGEVALSDEDDKTIEIIETEISGIWRSVHRVDVTAEPSGQVTRICKFGNLSAVICIEATDLEKGEFTIEDELRVNLTRGGRQDSIKALVNIFEGQSREPYSSLGQLNDNARRRINLGDHADFQTGWHPLLANLLETPYSRPNSLGNYVDCLGPVEAGVFTTLEFPGEAQLLLNAYSQARYTLLEEIGLRVDTGSTKIEHPIYASHPIYVHKSSQHVESLICQYLEAYQNILTYIKTAHASLDWGHLFVLTHIDCVVHWDNSPLKGAFFLVGPWHPLVVAKRFMVQAALYARADRYRNNGAGAKKFKHLCSLLGQVQGFRRVLSVSDDIRQVEHAFVCTTSDPGWHVAVKTNYPALSAQEGLAGLPDLAKMLRLNLGLIMEMGKGGSQNLPITILSNYLRAFPSRRSIGVRIRHGYAGSAVVKDVNAYLHADEGPTEQGEQLPGGVRLYLEEPLERDVDAEWTDPSLCIYLFEDDERCIQECHPDIFMLPPQSEVSFKSTPVVHKLPRGAGYHAVFSEPLRRLEEGNTFIPKNITYESDLPAESAAGIGGAFTTVLGQITGILDTQMATVSSIELPQSLGAPWVIIPGGSIDPAVLVKYVRDGADRSLQNRALWDYRLDLANKLNSFYILSTIPREFEFAVSNVFGRNDVAGKFIVELGKIGIAIGGEALKSGRRALGVIGLVGAVRLFIEKTTNGLTPLSSRSGSVGFLVPVDSFVSFFGNSDSSGGKRADLLAIQLVLPSQGYNKMRISACGVESKYVSGIFGLAQANAALEQGLATVREFKDLVMTSLENGAMPERLGLLELLRFGLRITCPSAPEKAGLWLETERKVYQAILAGEYEYMDAKYSAVLVSTEISLPGVAESKALPGRLWVRLTRDHWPGITDTPQIDSIRQELCTVFGNTMRSPPQVPSPVNVPHTSHGGDEPPEDQAPLPKPEPIDGSGATHIIEPQAEEESIEQERDAPLEKIFIGADEVRRMVYFNPQSPVDPLDNMNIMVTGSSGKGKTQFLKYLICKFREQGKNVLILDFKNDFASDSTFCAKAGLENVFVTFDGLPYNPLIPYPILHPVNRELYIQPSHHIAGIASVLKRTYRLGDQQQAAVKRAINMAFASADVPTTGSTPFTSDILFPDFSDVGNFLENENPTAYNRLDPLFTLDLFRNEYRDQSFHALVNRATVIDLSQIPSDEIKNALAQLIVLSAHAYYNAQPHSGTIRQFLVFDEAHRVLSSDYMLRLVRECRAYGVGTILSSQYPSDFPGEISSSTATKIIHGNDRDAERTRAIVQLLGCEGREGDVASLERFQAFLDNRHHPQTLLRTMNYPLYLVWVKLQELGTATREELSQAEGVNVSQLPIVNLVRQLELLGLAEERNGQVVAIRREDR